jgi:putative ABC transport system permease protein
MTITHIRTAFKFLKKNRLFALINTIGFSIALTVAAIVLMHVVNEFSFNQNHHKKKDIYRILSLYTEINYEHTGSPFVMAETLKKEVPQVDKATNVRRIREFKIIGADTEFKPNNAIGTSSDIFDIFTFRLLSAQSEQNLLAHKNAICLSRSLAMQVFGNINVVGKEVSVEIEEEKHLFVVSAVYDDLPLNSSFRADCLIHNHWGLSSINKTFEIDNAHENWNTDFWHTWILLNANANVDETRDELRRLSERHLDKKKIAYNLQCLSDVHLKSDHISNAGIKGNLKNVKLLLFIALLIIIVATVNYIILSTALVLKRVKEIAVRKANGAENRDIRRQLFVESMVMVFSMLPLSFLFTTLLLPYTNLLFEKNIVVIDANLGLYFLVFAVLLIIITVSTGFYTSYKLSRINMLLALKNDVFKSGNKNVMSSILIVAQLIIFCSFIFCGLVFYAQYRFAVNADMGFNRQNMLYIPVDEKLGNVNPFVHEIAQNPNIVGVGKTSSTLPTAHSGYLNVPNVQNPEIMVSLAVIDCDPEFIQTLELKIVEGRNFSREQISDKNKVCIMSKKAVQSLGIENPLASKWGELTIVGIVDDFHMHSFHHELDPVIIFYSEAYIEHVAIRYKPGMYDETLKTLESAWKKFYPEHKFESVTIETLFESQYQKEYKTTIIVTLSAILSMMIAILGIFGLTLYFLQQSTKEIGMRKILGSTNLAIAAKYVKRYVLLAVLANCISIPISYIIMREWLTTYSQHIAVFWWIYATTIGLSVVVIALTVFFQAIKASRMNPVEALRYE